LGHHSGDALLREVAARLRGELRGSDTVARLGGDEFAVLLTQVDDPDGAVITARKLLRMLERAFVIEGEHVHVGASLGIAMYPSHGGDADLLMRHADVAMYVAKRAGSGYAVYQAETDQHSPGRLGMIADLRQAIDRGQLELHYQPEVDLRTGVISGVEALVRWRHPVEGLLMPDQFIGLAEHTGIIRPLGLWVLAAAVEQVAVWQDEGRAIPVSVNLSMRNLHDPVLVDTVADLLQAHATDPSLLKFEITESTLMADPELALRVVRQLTAIGLSLAIDDFGTGYSSLAYLRRLPLKELKIDRSFVLDLVAEENARVIVRSTIDLGHNLGLKVVAEGVEDEATLAIVRDAGCDLVQGNLLCPAVPAPELPRGPIKR
jgi:predicted signal transduction protein with EAL and GGDEF domain